MKGVTKFRPCAIEHVRSIILQSVTFEHLNSRPRSFNDGLGYGLQLVVLHNPSMNDISERQRFAHVQLETECYNNLVSDNGQPSHPIGRGEIPGIASDL
jgi:hypothetical protein